MSKGNSIVIAVAIVGIAVIAFLWSRPAHRDAASRSPTRIIFLGYTNDSAGNRFARFSVSNLSCYPLELEGYMPCRIDLGIRELQSSSRHRSLASAIPLPIGKAATCDLPAALLPEGERWAVILYAKRKGLRNRWELFKENLSQHRWSIRGEYFEFKHYENYSGVK